MTPWKQCFVCRQATALTDMTSRQMVISVTKVNEHHYFFPDIHKTYGVADLCWSCGIEYDEVARRRRSRRLALIGGTGLGLFGWAYIGAAGLIGAVVVTLIGAFYRPKTKAIYLPQGRNA